MKRKWWHDKVAYQIYPKSFMDSNGDGVGDLRGIISKLDYLKSLGVDIIWISPVYPSPFIDQGYDISDYYGIDPLFGTMQDMDELLAKAREKDLYILMDLVLNHCSDQHEWFQKALKDPYGEYGKYFYFREGRNGKPPCNWRSYFGGSVWTEVPGYDNLYYLHMFARQQPDLNWENPQVRQELYRMIRWWCEKGVSGFRLDAIINIKKDLRFQDFPADADDGLCSPHTMLQYADGLHDLLQELKEEAFDPYQAFSIGELCGYRDEELALYIGDEGVFDSIFDFSTDEIGMCAEGWYAARDILPDEYRDAMLKSKQLSQKTGMMANIIENHDQPRGASRYIPEGDVNDTSKKMLAGVTLMAFGIPFLYQGQEIGMENTLFGSEDDIRDVHTRREYHLAREHGRSEKEALEIVTKHARDNARTPMQWSAQPGAGFTQAEPWMKLNPDYTKINVADQLEREDSVLNFYRKLIVLRKDPEYKETIVYGEQAPMMQEEKNLIAFTRRSEEKTLLILANDQREERAIELEGPVKKVLLDNILPGQAFEGQKKIRLLGYQFVLLEI